MKSPKKLLCIAVATVATTVALNIYAAADGGETSEGYIAEGISEAAELVADATDSSLADGLVGEDIEVSGRELLDSLSAENVWSEIKKMAADPISEALELLRSLLAIVLICAVFSCLYPSVETLGMSEGVSFLGSAAMVSALLCAQLPLLDGVVGYFERLSALMDCMIPVTGSVWAMGGNVACASAGTATLYAMTAITEKLCASAVLPVCCIMGAAAVCSALTDGTALSGFCGAVKKIYGFVIGLVMSVFIFCLGTQTAIAGAADSVSARGAKLLSTTVIPGVGSAVGESLRTVAGGVAYVKSVVGVGGIVLIAAVTLPTLLSLLLSRLAIAVAGGIAEAVGCKKESRLLGELSDIYGVLIGAVAVCAVAFVIAFALFVRCTVAIA